VDEAGAPVDGTLVGCVAIVRVGGHWWLALVDVVACI
jgi:hypothetical protein